MKGGETMNEIMIALYVFTVVGFIAIFYMAIKMKKDVKGITGWIVCSIWALLPILNIILFGLLFMDFLQYYKLKKSII